MSLWNKMWNVRMVRQCISTSYCSTNIKKENLFRFKESALTLSILQIRTMIIVHVVYAYICVCEVTWGYSRLPCPLISFNILIEFNTPEVNITKRAMKQLLKKQCEKSGIWWTSWNLTQDLDGPSNQVIKVNFRKIKNLDPSHKWFCRAAIHTQGMYSLIILINLW